MNNFGVLKEVLLNAGMSQQWNVLNTVTQKRDFQASKNSLFCCFHSKRQMQHSSAKSQFTMIHYNWTDVCGNKISPVCCPRMHCSLGCTLTFWQVKCGLFTTGIGALPQSLACFGREKMAHLYVSYKARSGGAKKVDLRSVNTGATFPSDERGFQKKKKDEGSICMFKLWGRMRKRGQPSI